MEKQACLCSKDHRSSLLVLNKGFPVTLKHCMGIRAPDYFDRCLQLFQAITCSAMGKVSGKLSLYPSFSYRQLNFLSTVRAINMESLFFTSALGLSGGFVPLKHCIVLSGTKSLNMHGARGSCPLTPTVRAQSALHAKQRN